MELLIDTTLLGLLVLTALAVTQFKDLFAVVMLTGIYGLLSASFFVTLDAVDVAFTEASVGAGISPLLMLTTLTMTGRFEKGSHKPPLLALAVVLVTGALLIVGTADMPAFGAADAPAQTHVAPRYIQESINEVGMPNIVTSVLASYRGYDTLGETVVIFTAGIGVLSLLMLLPVRKIEDFPPRQASMHSHVILRVVSKLLIPFILVFALYVQFHGDYGPGGGFQAGVIFAAAIILYSMLFGLGTARRIVSLGLVQITAALGALLYGCVGVVSLLAGKNYLDYDALAHDPLHGQHYGILLVELGVGITVASVMLIIFYSFASRIGYGRDGGRQERDGKTS